MRWDAKLSPALSEILAKTDELDAILTVAGFTSSLRPLCVHAGQA